MRPPPRRAEYPRIGAFEVTYRIVDSAGILLGKGCLHSKLGTGRFLRAVLVPALSEIGCEVVLAQTRGKSFPEYMMKRLPERTYEVDTVLQDGRVLTTVPITPFADPLSVAGVFVRDRGLRAWAPFNELVDGGDGRGDVMDSPFPLRQFCCCCCCEPARGEARACRRSSKVANILSLRSVRSQFVCVFPSADRGRE